MPDLRKDLLQGQAVVESSATGLAQAGQIQALPRALAGSRARASLETGACMHQQLSGGMPAVMAH